MYCVSTLLRYCMLAVLCTGCASAPATKAADIVKTPATGPSGNPMSIAAKEMWHIPAWGIHGPQDMAFSPDATVLAVRYESYDVLLWNVATREQVAPRAGFQPVRPFAFAPNGRTIVTGATARRWDPMLHLWDWHSGNETMTFPNPLRMSNAAVFSPDGSTLATARFKAGITMMPYGEISVWEVATGKLRYRTTFHDGPIYALSFSPDGRTLAVGSGNRWRQYGVRRQCRLRLCDVATGHARLVIDAGEGEVMAVVFTPDGSTIITASTDGAVLLWDATSGRLKASLAAQADSIALSPDGRWLVAAGLPETRGRVSLWDLATGKEQPGFMPQGVAGKPVTFASRQWMLATGSIADGSVIIWRVDRQRK